LNGEVDCRSPNRVAFLSATENVHNDTPDPVTSLNENERVGRRV
jgi:hypothetical protein